MNMAERSRNITFDCLLDTHNDLGLVKIKIYDALERLND